MTEDELRRAYGALRDQQRQITSAPDERARPSPEAIWSAVSGDLEPGERVRILDDALRAGAADDIAIAHTMHTAALATADEASTRRNGAGGHGARRWWPMAAAAALLVTVSIPLWRSASDSAEGSASDSTRYRDSGRSRGPQLAAPSNQAALPEDGRFVWHPVPDATGYLFEALGSDGIVVVTVSTADTLATLPDSVSIASRRRISGWWVTAILRDGTTDRSELRAVSPPQRP